ncbi:MAG: polysaccharide biosynthesis protein, partial [Clostridiaceae bacterium]|nr:polysaccharide biosynthesis protein [Clostridiaceae bacterium]
MASAVSNGLLFIYIFFIRSISPRSIFIITAMLDVFFIGGSRIVFRIGRRLRDNKSLSLNNAKRILIIGAGEAGVTIAREMLSHKELQSKPVAFVDENPEKIGKVINGIPVVGNLEKINEIILKKKVDEIIIAIPSAKP